MQKRAFRWISSLGGGSTSLFLGGIGVIAVVCLARMVGLWQGIELSTLDFFLRWRPAETPDERITLIEFTDEDIQALGAYPVPDAVLTDLLTDLQDYNPRVIGLDIFKDIPASDTETVDVDTDPYQALLRLLQTSPEILVIEKVLNSPIAAPAGVPRDKIGFVDAPLDVDGFIRRSLLATHSPFDEHFHFSLTIQLASRYLAAEGLFLDNGVRDPKAMRFGDTELPRLKPNSGGYVNKDIGGNPFVLINFRSGEQPFRRATYRQLQAGQVPADWLRDRIIIIGMTAISSKDYINSAAVVSPNPRQVPGLVLQAHTVSQIISAVLDRRPFLRPWAAPWEYLWIGLWGLIGMGLVHLKKKLPAILLIFIGLGILPIAIAYGLIFVGFWIPVFPVFIVYFLNGGSTVLYKIYQREQDIKIRLDERQRVIEQSYNTIHNGPLQALKGLIRKVSSNDIPMPSDTLNHELNHIDSELRSIYEFMQREYLTLQTRIYVTRNYAIDLEGPLHELLYQVYRNRIQESSSYFDKVKIKITDFCPIDASFLSLEDKEDIIRFLEEALCNVEQHSVRTTRLAVTCKQEQNDCIVQVLDNGLSRSEGTSNEDIAVNGTSLVKSSVGLNKSSRSMRGRGTRQAEALARRLGGRFARRPQTPKGTVCWLIWPVRPLSPWRLWQRRGQNLIARLIEKGP